MHELDDSFQCKGCRHLKYCQIRWQVHNWDLCPEWEANDG